MLRHALLSLSLTLPLVLAACDGADRLAAPPVTAERFGVPNAVVPSGGSIQAAIDAAAPTRATPRTASVSPTRATASPS